MSTIGIIEAGDLAALSAWIADGGNVDQRGPDGLTPLMRAAGHGRARMVELLLTAGADVFAVDSRAGATALHKAALSGNPDVAMLLLDHRAFIDQQTPVLGHTALMDAVIYKHDRVVRILLDRGARRSIRNHWGETALALARRDGLAAIAALIERRDRADAARVAAMPLVPAIAAGDLAAVRKMVAEGADVNARLPFTGTPDDDYTPLAIAAREGHADIAGVLLDAGADPRRIIGLFGGTPLHEASYFGHAKTVRTMTAPRDPASGPGPELDVQGALNGMSPLHDAVWHGHDEACRALVAAGHPLDLRTHAGLTARDLAVSYGYHDIAAELAVAARDAGAAGSLERTS